jgi:hypothetical protein
LTRLLRGRRGSEVQMRAPVAAGARVVVLNAALGQGRLTAPEARREWNYRWGPASRPIDDLSWQSAARSFEAAGLVPLAPAHLRFAWQESGDLLISWRRRDRAPSASSLTQAQIPMSEAAEAYDLEICDGAGAVVRSFAAIPEHSQLYSAAQQAADFPAGLPNPLTVQVYQLSAVVGRGRKKKEDLYVH